MVKITSSMIDIYTVPNTAPLQRRQFVIEPDARSQNRSTTLTRKADHRRYSLDAAEFLSDSSDSETSFFDDSDDNDDVTAFFGKHCHKFNNVRDGDNDTRAADLNDKKNRKNERQINNQSRLTTITRSSQHIPTSCEMLVSPRLNRKNFRTNKNNNNNNNNNKNSKTTSSLHPRRTTADDAIFEEIGTRPPVRNYSVPNLSTLCTTGNLAHNTFENNNKVNSNNKPSSPTEEEIVQRNSYLLSPRLKRKQIDITKSAAFKEIYAHNLRLYSAVLAKQVASSGQVGREMNEIRRNKLKERALSTETSKMNKGGYRRSQSFASGACSLRNAVNSNNNENSDETRYKNNRGKRSNSANSEILSSQIQQSTTITTMAAKLQPATEKGFSDEDLTSLSSSEENLEFRARSQSLVPSKEILKRITSSKITDENQNEVHPNDVIVRNERSQAAFLRKEQLQRKLESFDIMLDKTSDFLAKVKTMRKL